METLRQSLGVCFSGWSALGLQSAYPWIVPEPPDQLSSGNSNCLRSYQGVLIHRKPNARNCPRWKPSHASQSIVVKSHPWMVDKSFTSTSLLCVLNLRRKEKITFLPQPLYRVNVSLIDTSGHTLTCCGTCLASPLYRAKWRLRVCFHPVSNVVFYRLCCSFQFQVIYF